MCRAKASWPGTQARTKLMNRSGWGGHPQAGQHWHESVPEIIAVTRHRILSKVAPESRALSRPNAVEPSVMTVRNDLDLGGPESVRSVSADSGEGVQ
jgi:hypothetical protein